jgi:hypothetical protein
MTTYDRVYGNSPQPIPTQPEEPEPEIEVSDSTQQQKRQLQLTSVQIEAFDLFKKKNADYGDAFASHGTVGVLVRLNDKINRALSISRKGVALVDNESLRDTLIDLHNYAAMAIMLMDEDAETEGYVASLGITSPEACAILTAAATTIGLTVIQLRDRAREQGVHMLLETAQTVVKDLVELGYLEEKDRTWYRITKSGLFAATQLLADV